MTKRIGKIRMFKVFIYPPEMQRGCSLSSFVCGSLQCESVMWPAILDALIIKDLKLYNNMIKCQ